MAVDGTTTNNDQCELCLRGSYKDLRGMHACTLCGVTPLHHYGRDETGAISHDTWTESSCVACDAYEFKTGFNNNQCSFCSSGYYLVHVNQPCQHCNLMDGVIFGRNQSSFIFGFIFGRNQSSRERL